MRNQLKIAIVIAVTIFALTACGSDKAQSDRPTLEEQVAAMKAKTGPITHGGDSLTFTKKFEETFMNRCLTSAALGPFESKIFSDPTRSKCVCALKWVARTYLYKGYVARRDDDPRGLRNAMITGCDPNPG